MNIVVGKAAGFWVVLQESREAEAGQSDIFETGRMKQGHSLSGKSSGLHCLQGLSTTAVTSDLEKEGVDP
jgi:hypothetical protein